MKVMIRRNQAGVLSAYIAKKDLEEPIVEVEKAEIWGGLVKLATTVLPITVEARRLGEMEI